MFALPAAASALTAVTTEPVPLRAGPAGDFPVVDQIPGGVNVYVNGCVRAYRWCDVSWRDAHGWVQGDDLAYLESGRRVSIIEYGPRVSLPIIAFSVDSYWDRYYRGRPYYGRRAHFRTVWRDRDHRAGHRERRSERNATERLKEKRSYRSTEQERNRASEHRRSEKRDGNRHTERNKQLRNSHGYRSMDRDNSPGRNGGLNRPSQRPHAAPERGSRNDRDRGNPQANAGPRSQAGPTGGGGGRGHGPSGGGGRGGNAPGGQESKGR
jgi:uncharacterized protein YraI